jgi:hypothetical protein
VEVLWGGKWEKLDKRSMNEGCLVGKDLQRLLNATSTTTTVVVVAVVAILLTAPSLFPDFSFAKISVACWN